MNKFTSLVLIVTISAIAFHLGSRNQKQLVFSKDSVCTCQSSLGKLCYFNEVQVAEEPALAPTTTDFDGKVTDDEVLIKCKGNVEFAAVKI